MPLELASRLRRLRRSVLSLPRRAYLTLRYHGARELAFRLITFPVRLTPLGPRLGLPPVSDPARPARRWYRQHRRRVTVVIPTYGEPRVVAEAVRSVRRTTSRELVRIIVSDDGSPAEHREGLRALAQRHDVELILGDVQRGFAANCNRGLRAAPPDEDVVLLNSDVVAHSGWLQALQHAAYVARRGHRRRPAALPRRDDPVRGRGAQPVPPGVVRPPLPWPRRRARRGERPARRADGHGRLHVSDARVLDDLGLLDESYEMAFEDADYCVRAWDHGHRVLYAPAAVLTHHESKTRGLVQGSRELRSQALFWSRWGTGSTAATCGCRGRAADRLRRLGRRRRRAAVHVEGLRERGHDVRLITGEAAGLEELDLGDQGRDGLAGRGGRLGGLGAARRSRLPRARPRRGAPSQPQRRRARLAGLRPEFDYVATSDSIARQLRTSRPVWPSSSPGASTSSIACIASLPPSACAACASPSR